MWTKLSHALKSKQVQDGPAHEQSSEVLAGPSTSPSKRKGVFHRDDGSLRLNSPLKLPNIPKKVKSTFSLHGNSSQLTLTPDTAPNDLSRRPSTEMLSTSRPKATRRSSFNILITRRPSIDALRGAPETPRSMSRREESPHTRNRAATFGGSVRSILREANTPGTGKSVRFDAYDIAPPEPSRETGHRSLISRSTPPEETFLEYSGSSDASSAMPRFASPSRYSRPSVTDVFSPSDSSKDSQPLEQGRQLTSFFDKLDVSAISSLSPGLHVPNSDLPGALTSTPNRDGGEEIGSKESPVQTAPATKLRAKDRAPKLPPVSHDRSTSFSFGQTVFHSMADSDSKRSSSGESSLISDVSSSSSSPSVGRHRSASDTVFMSMMRASPPKIAEGANTEPSAGSSGKESTGAPEPDPFSANATTYYTPQTMIPTTPPQGSLRHVRRASKEESIIFSLQTQLDMQNELCGQFEADLRARDELVEVLRKKLVEAEEEDAKKRKFLRVWKKKVGELERTCRFLEDEVEGSRQESMERSVMDEASSEALRMLHRQISALERERDGWRRTEAVLREEVRRLEALAGERLNEAAMLRESLGGRSEKERKQKGTEQMVEVEAEKQRHKTIEMAWQVEKEDLLFATDNIKLSNIGLVADLDDLKQRLRARDDGIGALNAKLSAAEGRAERAAESCEATEAGKCALAMERDSLKLQVIKLQEKTATAEVAERKVFELEDDVQGLWDIKESLEKEREELKERIREGDVRFDAVNQKLKASENRVIELAHERQYALDNVSRLEDNIRRRDIEAAEDSQRNFKRATDIEELREQMSRMRREQSASLEAALQDATNKQMEIDAQKTTLCEFQAEIVQLKSQTRELQQESADKEVHIVQITKQRAQDKQDLEGLNIALDSKQQELELLKRRLVVRGTAGNTPAQSSKSTLQRRDSSVYTTPRTASRPLSFTSESGADSGRERKPSAESCTKIPALSKSKRLSSSTTAVPTPPKSTRGSMGPPPLRSRSSLVGAPATTTRTLTRSSSLACTTASAKAKVSNPAVEQGEKENADVSGSRRLSRIPTLAL
ncbi:hypothetical protein FB451DRAFT_1253554 [Mycena latifolia]|nr:hypothetical protein FB451DRAFT_1253554 [Mycena latifolia]